MSNRFLIRYTDRREKVKNAITEVLQVFEEYNLSGKDNLQKYIDQINEPFTIMVLGELKSGKSTLLNAMIGEDILPEGEPTVTHLIALIEWGSDKKASITYKNGKQVEITLDEAKQYLDKRSGKHTKDVDYITITLDWQMAKDVNWIDTPGLKSIFHEHSERTLSFIWQSDLAIFVTPVKPAFGGREVKTMKSLKADGKDFCVLINQVDLLKTAIERQIGLDEIKTGVIRKVEKEVEKFPYFFVSGKLIKEKKLDTQEFSNFLVYLEDFLAKRGEKVHLKTSLQNAIRLIDEREREFEEKLKKKENYKDKLSKQKEEFKYTKEIVIDIKERAILEIENLWDELARQLADTVENFLLRQTSCVDEEADIIELLKNKVGEKIATLNPHLKSGIEQIMINYQQKISTKYGEVSKDLENLNIPDAKLPSFEVEEISWQSPFLDVLQDIINAISEELWSEINQSLEKLIVQLLNKIHKGGRTVAKQLQGKVRMEKLTKGIMKLVEEREKLAAVSNLIERLKTTLNEEKERISREVDKSLMSILEIYDKKFKEDINLMKTKIEENYGVESILRALRRKKNSLEEMSIAQKKKSDD